MKPETIAPGFKSEGLEAGFCSKKKISNAMSHFALVRGKEYFYMLYEARHHMPCEDPIT